MKNIDFLGQQVVRMSESKGEEMVEEQRKSRAGFVGLVE
jgi:hypothetical protein